MATFSPDLQKWFGLDEKRTNDREVIDLLVSKLAEKYSPEEVAALLKKQEGGNDASN